MGGPLPDREQKMAEARRMHANGASFAAISRHLGVSDSTVYRWLTSECAPKPRPAPPRYRIERTPKPPPPRPSARMRRLAERSARIRSRRSEIKARIAVGELDVREVIADPPPILRTTRIMEILACAPWIGERRARTILRRLAVDERAVFGWTSAKRRAQIAAAVPRHKQTAGKRRVRERVAA